MQNPWLEIPLQDYEGHMSLPSIDQAAMLADEFEFLIKHHRPPSVAIVGCAGGNGLERIEAGRLERVVGVDINPQYIERSRERYGGRLPNLELHCADVESSALQFEPVSLIYAALLFEYVDLPPALQTLKRCCRPNGVLATLLQLSHQDQLALSRSPYTSLSGLEPAMRLLAPHDLCREAAAAGFTATRSKIIKLPSGKEFWAQYFRA